MSQGIWTKYLPATNSRGARIKAIARIADSIGPEMALTDSRDYALDTDADHARVAALRARKLGWAGLWHGGGRPDNVGNMYVNCAHAYAGAPTSSIGREGRDWFYIEREGEAAA